MSTETTSDWESAGILQRLVSCIFIGFCLGSLIFVPLLGLIGSIRPESMSWFLSLPGVRGDWGEFVGMYIMAYTSFSAIVLFVVQRGWE